MQPPHLQHELKKLERVKDFLRDEEIIYSEDLNSYRINDETWLDLKTDSNTYIVPKKNIHQLILLSIVTLRGILHAKTENTVFNKYLIQSFNISELIKEDYIIMEDGVK